MDSDTMISRLQKVRESQVFEDCAELLEHVTEFAPGGSLESLQIIEGLTTLWEKHGHLDTSTCNWQVLMFKAARKQLLHALMFAEAFYLHITLASKMFEWCGNRLFLLEEPRIDSQESTTIQKVVPEAFLLANAVYTSLDECSYLTEGTFVDGVESYVCQSLSFLRISCMHEQKCELHDFQKTAQDLLSLALKVLLKFRAKVILTHQDKNTKHRDGATSVHAGVVCYGVNILVDLGKFAAANGRSWVGMVNVAWKGVTSMLQTSTGKEVITGMIDISGIITSTVACTLQSLRYAAQTWQSLLDKRDDLTKAADLKRLCIPVKFFLINTIRVASNYPLQAVCTFRDIATCALKIVALRVALSKHGPLKFAAEAIAETVEPSLFILLHTLLRTSELERDCKVQFLEHLIEYDKSNKCSVVEGGAWESSAQGGSMHAEFSNQGDNLNLGRLAIFLDLLQSCNDCGKDIAFELARRLDLLLKMISDATIYPDVFQLQIFATHHLDASCKPAWQCLYIAILNALQTFYVFIAGTEAWATAEEFLFRNALHPHVLCRELILEVWCFIAHHGDTEMIEDHVNGLFLILSEIINSPIASGLSCPVRTLARLICSIAKAAPDTAAIRLYQLAFGKNPFLSLPAAVIAAALIKEHFPVHVLPDCLKTSLFLDVKHAFSNIRSQSTETVKDETKHASKFLLVQEEVLSCFLGLLIQETFEQDVQEEEKQWLIPTTVSLLQAFPSETNRNQRAYSASIMNQSLKIISRLWSKLHSQEITCVLVALHELFRNDLCDDNLKEMRPVLAEILAGLSKVIIPEDENNPLCCALWELYYLVLRERHWALAHLSLVSFGYFAAHTSCNELWRFVPPNAALAYDARTGAQADEDSFMSSLRCFLEKEAAHTTLMVAKEELKVLQFEGQLQEKALHLLSCMQIQLDDLGPQEIADQGHMDIDSEGHVDYTESPVLPEIDQAIKMLQEGLTLLKEKLPLWLKESGHNLEQQHQISDQLGLLADVIAQLGVIHTS